jgi:1,4-alpha-glucan branching enzyme
LNYTYKNESALWQLDDTYDGFDWIDFHDADNSVVSFLRKSRDGEIVVFVVNATPLVRHDYRLASRSRASIARSSTPTRKRMAAAMSAILGACEAKIDNGWRATIPFSFSCRRWPR